MTADSNTLSGQEPEPQHRNREDVLPTDPGPVPPAADPKQTRFSAAAITGMVLVSIGWAIVFRPLVNYLSWGGGSSFYLIDLYVFLGPIALLGGVTGFIVELTKGNKKLAARLYIVPSLIWQGGVLAALLLLLIALAGYDAP